jgi:hypothetical protein
MAQDLEIVELKIKMHTNKDTIEELTADKFKTDKPVSGKYPFLCTNYRYSKELLNYKTLSERVSLFFNRTQFYNFITASKIKKKQKFISANNVDNTVFEKKIQETMDDSEFYKGLKNLKSVILKISKLKLNKQNIIENLVEKPKTPIGNEDEFVKYLSNLSKKKEINNAIVKENITIMLNALFPISFPIQDQVTLMDDTNLDLMNMIKRTFKTREYVYLNIGKVSTVIQVIWLNTISSNPTYYQLYQKIKKYYKIIFNFIDENITDKYIQNIVDSSSDDDSTKLKKIKTYLNTRFIVSSVIVDTLPDKNLCILFFLLFNNDEQKLYNQFIQKFVKQFVINDTTSRYGNSDQYYRTEFFNYLKKTIPEIEIHETYIKEIVEYLPPKRVSTDKNLKNSLVNKNDFSRFFELFEKDGKNYSGIDKIGNGVYEIQIGIALVGGKITTTNYTFLCNYNSHRLGKNLNYLIKNTEEDSQNVQLYNYIDLENVKDTTEYIGVVNSKFKTQKNNKGGYRRRNKKKTRRQIKI